MSPWPRESEIAELNRIVVMFLDFAEDQARRRKQIFLHDWQTRLDEFLRFNDRDVLPHAGHVSREAANEKAAREYEQFAQRRREHQEADSLRELESLVKPLSSPAPKRRKEPE